MIVAPEVWFFLLFLLLVTEGKLFFRTRKPLCSIEFYALSDFDFSIFFRITCFWINLIFCGIFFIFGTEIFVLRMLRKHFPNNVTMNNSTLMLNVRVCCQIYQHEIWWYDWVHGAASCGFVDKWLQRQPVTMALYSSQITQDWIRLQIERAHSHQLRVIFRLELPYFFFEA